MGCGQSIDAEASKNQQQSKAIDEELKKAKAEEAAEYVASVYRRTVKALMLGAGESGKSTIVKQMRLMYAEPYTSEERHLYKDIVYSNALQSMQVRDSVFRRPEARADTGRKPRQAVVSGFEHINLELPLDLRPAAEYLPSISTEHVADRRTGDMLPEIRDAIIALWADGSTRRVVGMSSRFQLNDSAEYPPERVGRSSEGRRQTGWTFSTFFDAMPRVGAPGYLPTDQDILRTRVRSTGIVEHAFDVRGQKLRVLDVGGQRSERKKWIHCFENVNMLIFVAAISEYDQVLFEDSTVNRLAEATMLWESVANSRWFERSSFVLMLNKIDIFAAKVRSGESPLVEYFPDFTGPPGDLDAAKQYMKHNFVSLSRKKDRGLYVHLTCATDTDQTRVVVGAVMDQVLTRLLSEVGLI
ncbi:hypothetical protein BMF94_3972 [Rhodotorula taiwanensis]|uniref:Uncharacterized protein n=1 Tax=Rhodotorula taiwanensis TaxID=741276 RepID=A0A2S5B887_9BASI|nr:hypothetical protein BMF94_3972 [Rhodotorula taiwanensis]